MPLPANASPTRKQDDIAICVEIDRVVTAISLQLDGWRHEARQLNASARRDPPAALARAEALDRKIDSAERHLRERVERLSARSRADRRFHALISNLGALRATVGGLRARCLGRPEPGRQPIPDRSWLGTA